MKRTTIFLPDALHDRLRQEAFHKRVSMAELIRLRLEPQRKPRKRDPLSEAEGIFRDGGLSKNIDGELYGIE